MIGWQENDDEQTRTDIHHLSGIRTHGLQRPRDQGLRLLQRGHWGLQEDIKNSLCITGATATFADDTAIWSTRCCYSRNSK
jgi:hypothetical protein